MQFGCLAKIQYSRNGIKCKRHLLLFAKGDFSGLIFDESQKESGCKVPISGPRRRSLRAPSLPDTV